jgi:hypothetical protein
VAVTAGLAGAWTLTAPQQTRAATVASPILTEVSADDFKSILNEWSATEVMTVHPRNQCAGRPCLSRVPPSASR